ncbi:MAG: efflux RND transporter periplasmic adaptor subunit [Candidatus Omnitrophota bacterium]|nr:efflux RND transporter periplasmic adaptor subunit [Candidatus Omnitrophota bacterium]
MNKKKMFLMIVMIVAVLALILLVFIFKGNRSPGYLAIEGKNESADKAVYYCPMHPDFTADKPGSCAICGMSLVKKEKVSTKNTGKNKILHYRNPMDPEVTSPVPMKDSMGMDYVPVYEGEKAAEEAGIYMSPEKQQMIGVKKEKIEKRGLAREILTVGKVAYDPELYVAQEEYLQSLKTVEATRKSVLPSVSGQSKSLLEAAGKKLILLGMTKDQIEELGKQGKAQENLYLPLDEDTAWVYLTIYEYEMGLIKEGVPVELETVAYPGVKFSGKISAITPVLNAQTRSVQARAEVADPEHKLKPEMFVNIKIKIDLGEKLAVPESAVLDTGTRKIVYLAKEEDMLEAREVTLGQKAAGFYEVLDGLKEGDMVVTSGNFLVDSESKLKGAVSSSEHKHGE